MLNTIDLIVSNERDDKTSKKRSNASDYLCGNMPKKRFFRSRAHCNPLSHNNGFDYPINPIEANETIITNLYPNISNPSIDFLDVGMGFGGLTIALSELFPNKITCGMEIRAKVCEYVKLRIDGLRLDYNGKDNTYTYQNVSCLRTNCMRYLPNYFKKHQLEKIFFCFPDPHFKAKNHRRRIVSYALLSEYAYILKPGGRLYTITDVEALHDWHVEKCDSHPLFQRIYSNNNFIDDVAVKAMIECTEEGIKVARLGGKKYFAVYERLAEVNSDKLPIHSLFK